MELIDKNEIELRKSLTELSRSLRLRDPQEHDPEPRFVDYDTIRYPDGTTARRKKVILMSGGCSVPTCTMCPFTNENNYASGVEVDLMAQVDDVVARQPGEPPYEVLALYNDGSFFAQREVPSEVQLRIAKAVAAAPGVRRLVVESLPQFVNDRTLAPFMEALGDVELEIGIGLQSSNDLVRETLVNTSFTRKVFERSIAVMQKHGAIPKVYVMIKPPFLTDGEAVTDAVDTVRYVAEQGIDGVTLCPTRVSRDTVAWLLWEKDLYQPPNLWTVVDVVRRAHDEAAVRVACINLRGSDFESVFPESCDRCADGIVDGLLAYGESGDLAALPEPCSCRPAESSVPLDNREILRRTRAVVDSLQQATT